MTEACCGGRRSPRPRFYPVVIDWPAPRYFVRGRPASPRYWRFSRRHAAFISTCNTGLRTATWKFTYKCHLDECCMWTNTLSMSAHHVSGFGHFFLRKIHAAAWRDVYIRSASERRGIWPGALPDGPTPAAASGEGSLAVAGRADVRCMVTRIGCRGGGKESIDTAAASAAIWNGGSGWCGLDSSIMTGMQGKSYFISRMH